MQLIYYLHTFMITVLAQVHQSRKISRTRMTSSHGALTERVVGQDVHYIKRCGCSAAVSVHFMCHGRSLQ